MQLGSMEQMPSGRMLGSGWSTGPAQIARAATRKMAAGRIGSCSKIGKLWTTSLDSGGGETMPSKALHFEWVRGFNSNRILSKINKIRKIDGQRCSFQAGDYAFWLPVLNSAIRADRTA